MAESVMMKMTCVNGNCGGYYGKPKCLCYHSDPKKNKKATEEEGRRYEKRTRVKSEKARLAEEQADELSSSIDKKQAN